MASATGAATIDFGSHPGANETSVAVTGQSSILGTSKAEAFFMADDTSADHTASDHKYAGVFITLSCGTPSAATGFTIYARSPDKMTGQWAIRWVWVD
jgi:hypothetical protein